jgi:2-amino-4-hydroxy-6-hydroxymethyldihydropteridine diphosphokinase
MLAAVPCARDEGRVHDYVIGLGSNLGDCRGALTRACDGIARLHGTRITARSYVYLTPPMGPPQPDYLNAAVRIASALEAEALLDALLTIEATMGRVRTERWGPRTIDLDILWSAQPFESARLSVPHTGLMDRAFALAPLLDVAPELAATYAAHLKTLGGPPKRLGLL